MQKIKVYCENNSVSKEYSPGITLTEIAKDMDISLQFPVLGAKVNNQYREMSYELYKPKIIRFIDYSTEIGFRMYSRSLSFVLMKAVKDVFPNAVLKIEHSVSNGVYCELHKENDDELKIQDVFDLGSRMREIISADLPFSHEEKYLDDAIKLFEENNLMQKAKLFKSRTDMFASVYHLDDQIDYFYGVLVPSTGYLERFDLVKYYNGMLLMFPDRKDMSEMKDLVIQNKMFEIFQEYKEWGEILGVEGIGDLNNAVETGDISELIKVGEALHEKRIAQIADRVYCQKDKLKVVLISGPSSSGKTSFAKRLSIQLRAIGMKPIAISLDNYFVDREKTPLDEHGEYDFESLKALDVDYFNDQLLEILDGKEVLLPRFSFDTGKRFYADDYLKLEENGVLIIEGIHGLNPGLTPRISTENKFKIYVSALTTISLDNHNRIPTTNNRLLRRIVRDYKYRSYSAQDTIKRWPSVRRGEQRNIFPFQEEADVMFNSALLFELGVLKKYAEPILKKVPKNCDEYAEAVGLLKFLSYLEIVPDEEIPPTSLVREFIGGSSFRYH